MKCPHEFKKPTPGGVVLGVTCLEEKLHKHDKLTGEIIYADGNKWFSVDRTLGVEAVVGLLKFIGEDPEREGLLETPVRVAKAWREWTKGYNEDPKDILKVFEDGAENYDEMVVQRHLPFYSHCEHHMAPFFGDVTVAYIPKKKIVGLSKLARLTDIFTKRLQVQERITVQIADALQDNLDPQGVGVYIKARHLCMESRGVEKQGEDTVTSALRGVFKQGVVRAEFMTIALGK